MSVINYSQKTTIENQLKEVQNTMTGSAGGWPSDTHAGFVNGFDFAIQSGSDDLKIYEYNTNVHIEQAGNLFSNLWTDISNYVVSKSYNSVVVYGSYDFGQYNPPEAKQSTISASFAQHNISSSFNYSGHSSEYLSMRGDASHDNTFHLFITSPTHTDDNIHKMVSCSYDKRDFRTFLGDNHSSYLISTYTTSSKAQKTGVLEYPDYVLKNYNRDASIMGYEGSGIIEFNSYLSNMEGHTISGSYTGEDGEDIWWYENVYHSSSMSTLYEASVTSGTEAYTETFVISSGSSEGDRRYLGQGRVIFLTTPDSQTTLGSAFNSKFSLLRPPNGEVDQSTQTLNYNWKLKPFEGPSTPEGANIRMYDGSTKVVENVQVGDVVKSYQPIGMPDSDLNYLNYSVTDLSGSFASGSVVVSKSSQNHNLYYLVNNTYKVPQLGTVFVDRLGLGVFQFVKGYQLQNGDKLFNQDGSWIEITSVSEVNQNQTFYSLDVEDIDTYFSSDILVHNLPKKG